MISFQNISYARHSRPNNIWHVPYYLFWAGVLLLFCYAFFKVLWPAVGDFAETGTAILGLITLLVYGAGVRRSAALQLLLATIVIQIIVWVAMVLDYPEWVPDNPQLDRLAKWFIFLAVAWWLNGNTQYTFWLWSVAFIGFVLATFSHGAGITNWVNGILEGQRVGFGIRNNQHASMIYGVCLLGLVTFSRRFFYRSKLVLWRFFFWFILVNVTVCAIVIGQTRAVWLGLIFSMSAMFFMYFFMVLLKENRKKILLKFFTAFLVFLALAAFLFSVFGHVLIERATVENSVIRSLLSGSIESVPYTSIGIRIHSWVAAFQWIGERPFLGWGPSGRSLVIDQTPWLPSMVKENFGHLHNTFIEIWVSYGLLGVLLVLAMTVWIGGAAWRAWRGAVLPNDMALFSVGFFLYWAVVNQFEAYMSFWTGVYVFNIVVGGIISHYWKWLFVPGRYNASVNG